mgnify:CR=1 FL=1
MVGVMPNHSIKYILAVILSLSQETSRAEDVFAEERKSGAANFTAFEEANSDLEMGASSPSDSGLAPADQVVEDVPQKPAKAVAEERKERPRNIIRVERNELIERLTLKNGDTVINVKAGADPDKAMQAALGLEPAAEEAPIKPSEDWTKLPEN